MFLVAQTSLLAEHAQVAVEAVQQVAEHAEHADQAAGHGIPHSINWVTLLANAMGDTTVAHMLVQYEKLIFSAIVIVLIATFCIKVSSNLKMVPGRLQMLLETIVIAVDDMVCGVTGPKGRVYTPLVGSFFIYILVSNLFGLIPLQNSSTAYITTTAPLALVVFFYVQWLSFTRNGFLGYMYHLAGSPKELVTYLLIPLNFPLHVLGEFTKPLSLMFRLYGNVMAGHILVALFVGMGLQMMKHVGIPVGMPMHLPFLFLEILVSCLQPFVFAVLCTVYISMALPHDHAEERAH
ncbi:F-type H+-transporting ATPase subunit a [Gammaproteobacteria bacterium]